MFQNSLLHRLRAIAMALLHADRATQWREGSKSLCMRTKQCSMQGRLPVHRVIFPSVFTPANALLHRVEQQFAGRSGNGGTCYC